MVARRSAFWYLPNICVEDAAKCWFEEEYGPYFELSGLRLDDWWWEGPDGSKHPEEGLPNTPDFKAIVEYVDSARRDDRFDWAGNSGW